ncbi:ABZJ_00895 family protein [Psychrobacter sp. 1U2]|uniref:ABZJ_00895 family protein n=1 Tax=Psychrobacter sp. 1U2 TaxID=3453577 RepID=UPI003F489F26
MSRKSANLSKSKAQSVISPSASPVKITPYLGFFMLGYILASALLMLLQTQIALNPQLVTLLSILVGAFIAVHKFSKYHRRALRKDEIIKLAVGGTGVVWLMNALYFFAIWLWLFDDANRQVFIEMSLQQPLPLLAALIAIMLLTFISAGIGIWLFNRLFASK